MLESALRDWVRKAWEASELNWIEPARGSSVGLPDVSLPLIEKGARLPVELKAWARTRKGIVCALRPAQIRYHILEAKAGRRSAILVALENEEFDGFDLLAIPGHAVPRETYPKGGIRGRTFSGASETPRETRKALEALFRSETFWGR